MLNIVHLILPVIQLVEKNPDNATSDETANCETNIHPHNGRIEQSRHKGLAYRGTKCRREQEETLHERFHPRWRLGVCILVSCR